MQTWGVWPQQTPKKMQDLSQQGQLRGNWCQWTWNRHCGTQSQGWESGRRAKKAGRHVLPLIFLSFFLVHLLTTSIYSRKTTVDKNSDVASFQDNNRPLSRLVFFFLPVCFSDNTNRSKWKLKEDGTSVAPPQHLCSAQSTAPLILPVSTQK